MTEGPLAERHVHILDGGPFWFTSGLSKAGEGWDQVLGGFGYVPEDPGD